MLPISVVPSVAQTQFGSPCCIPASKALIPLVDSFLVDAPHGALAGPRSRPRVPRMPHGLYVVDVDHVGVLVASDAKHHVGLRPPAPFANVPSERHCFAPHDRCARLRPSLPSGEPGPPNDASINKECYLVDPITSLFHPFHSVISSFCLVLVFLHFSLFLTFFFLFYRYFHY